MGHRYSLFAIFMCLLLVLPACKNYEKENQHLQDELRMVREESDYLKAEIVGLKRELAEMTAKVKEEREALQRKLQEERDQLHQKLQEERDAMKKAQEAARKRNEAVKGSVPVKENGGAVKKDVKDPAVTKKETKESMPKPIQTHPNDSRTPPSKNPQ